MYSRLVERQLVLWAQAHACLLTQWAVQRCALIVGLQDIHWGCGLWAWQPYQFARLHAAAWLSCCMLALVELMCGGWGFRHSLPLCDSCGSEAAALSGGTRPPVQLPLGWPGGACRPHGPGKPGSVLTYSRPCQRACWWACCVQRLCCTWHWCTVPWLTCHPACDGRMARASQVSLQASSWLRPQHTECLLGQLLSSYLCQAAPQWRCSSTVL